MRAPLTVLAGLFLSAVLSGCGGATIPEPPSDAKDGPPPGTSPDMTKIVKKGGGGMPPARPPAKPAGK